MKKKLPKWMDNLFQQELERQFIPLLRKNKALQQKFDSLTSKYKKLRKELGRESEFVDFVNDNQYGFKDFLRVDESEKPKPRTMEGTPGSLQ